MEGQWSGPYEGSATGTIVLDLDDCDGHFEGHAFAFDSNNAPSTIARVRTNGRVNDQSIEVQLGPLHPITLNVISHDELAELIPDMHFPRTANIELNASNDHIAVTWRTDIGTTGSGKLLRSRADSLSDYVSDAGIISWKDFKDEVLKLDPGRFIFRGQCCCKRLRTSFHRSKRKDLIKFIHRDIPALHRALSAKINHVFELSNPLQNAAFWNLIQHHGYPTPLLDWSESPFVAAFFAFSPTIRRNSSNEVVRIFMFDKQSWCSDFNQLQKVAPARPHFSILEALSIENHRATPQQALSSVTNVDDIETYIHQRELENRKIYLRVFDLLTSERISILRELSLMGITAGSLFPGIDGVCEDFRYRFFGYPS